MLNQVETDALFTELHPTSYGYAKHADDEYSYMNRHADAPVLAARVMLESWYSHYPSLHRPDLVRRFRSKNHKQHDGAFWELFLHEMFRRMGYGVQVHPNLDGNTTHPDFLLTTNGVAFAGPAGYFTDWHHIVEQTPGNLVRFGPYRIHSSENLIRVPRDIHWQITGHYNSTAFGTRQTVRRWLAPQSFEAQHDYGLEILRRYGIEQ